MLNELDRTRQDKTDMVKAMVEERNAAADEAGALQRNISGLNARIRQLTDDLEQANRARKSLRSNLRRQVISELRGAGWKAPQGYGNGLESDEDHYITSTGGGKKGNKGAIRKQTENPIAKMRRLREALTQSGSGTDTSPSINRQEKEAQKKNKRTSQKKSSDGGSGRKSRPTSSGSVPPIASSSTTPINMTPPPSTPETDGVDSGVGSKQMIASDLGSPVDIVDRNPRDIGFEPPTDGSGSSMMMMMDENINGDHLNANKDPVEDSMNRTERFLEKRRRRDTTLQQQVDKDRVKRESRESILEQQVGQKARRTSSREGTRLPGI